MQQTFNNLGITLDIRFSLKLFVLLSCFAAILAVMRDSIVEKLPGVVHLALPFMLLLPK